MRLALPLALVLALISATLESSAPGAWQCRAPMPPASAAPNIFSAAQEVDLGDAIAERFEGYLRVIEDEALTTRLRAIGDRLAAHLPQTGLQIRLQLIDVGEANAFAVPGGRIYVTRKLVGLTRREDELAAVIGHELGHLVTRQQSIAVTKQLKQVLGVTALGDRKDVFEKYNALIENAGRKPGVFQSDDRENADQLEADRVGLFAVAASGYDPKAHAELYDRFTGANGNTGSFFSRLFGTVSPDARRLAEMMKGAAALPAGCAPEAAPTPAEYHAWQLEVAMANVASREEKLPGLVRQTPLSPFRDRVQHVRFSPDGRFVLVQDDSSVFVIERQPFALRFRIPSRRALQAEFSPDSTTVVFHTPDLRVERWSVEKKMLAEVHDVHWPQPCLGTAVSPDGRLVACVDTDGHFTVLETESGRQVFQKKSFYQLTAMDLFVRALNRARNLRTSGALQMTFSPSSQFLAVGFTSYAGSNGLIYDVAQKTALPLKDPAKRLLTGTFTFAGPDRLVGLNPQNPQKSGVLKLPEGTVLEEVTLPLAALGRATQSKYVVIRPVQPYPVGFFDLTTKLAKTGVDALATDVYDDQYVIDTGAGDVGLFAVEGKRLLSRITLPPSPLAAVRTVSVSPDFHWLAVSGETRGAVWDTTRPQGMAYMRDFDGSLMEDSGMLFADFPKAGQNPRAIMRFDAATRTIQGGSQVPSQYAAQYGPWLFDRRVASGSVEFVLSDVRKPEPNWTRKFDRDAPDDYWLDPQSDAVVLVYLAESPAGRILVAKDERLKKTVDRGDVKGDFVLEILDAATGNLRSRVLIETGKGSFHIDGVLVRGERMFVTDSLGRVLVYSLASGDVTGYAVGDNPTVSPNGAVLSVKTGEGRLAIYDVKSMVRRAELRFKNEVVFSAFSPDAANLFALTADQTAHVIGLAK